MKLGTFVTARLKDTKLDCRQGAIISLDPLRIRGQSGLEYECEGEPQIAINPPETCIGCGLPLGSLCKACEDKLAMVERVLSEHGMKISLDIAPRM